MLRQLSRRSVLRAVVAGAGAVTIVPLLAACSGATAPSNGAAQSQPAAANNAAPAANTSGGTLKIGLLSGFSGPYAAFGPDMATAIDVFLDKHNGSIGGLNATVIKEDEGTAPQDALNKASKLVEQDKVNVVMGLVSSANALDVRDLLDASKTPTIISNAGADDLTGAQRSPYIIRVSFSSWQQGAPSGKYAVAQGGKKVVGMAPV